MTVGRGGRWEVTRTFFMQGTIHPERQVRQGGTGNDWLPIGVGALAGLIKIEDRSLESNYFRKTRLCMVSASCCP